MTRGSTAGLAVLGATLAFAGPAHPESLPQSIGESRTAIAISGAVDLSSSRMVSQDGAALQIATWISVGCPRVVTPMANAVALAPRIFAR